MKKQILDYRPLILYGVLSAMTCGCENKNVNTNNVTTNPGVLSEPSENILENEWFACYMADICIGYENLVVHKNPEDVRLENHSRQQVSRFGTLTTAQTHYSESLTPDGRLKDCHATVWMGGQPMEFSAHATATDTGQTIITAEIKTSGTQQKTILTPPHDLPLTGAYGVEYLLQNPPVRPGQKRHLTRLELLNLHDVELECLPPETVAFPDGTSVPLYPVRAVSRMIPDSKNTNNDSPGKQLILEETFWVDGKGLIWKRHRAMLNLTYWRMSREKALREVELAGKRHTEFPGLDFGEAVSVPVRDFDAAQVQQLSALPEKTYRLYPLSETPQNADMDFGAIFEDAGFQEKKIITEVGKNVLEIRVFRSNGPSRSDFSSLSPTEKECRAGSLIQSDAPKVMELAGKVAAGETDARKIALAIEKFVYDYIRDKNYARGFLTAVEVAETPTGDCKAHAVLLAAIARAKGIPTRVVQGMVFVPEEKAFAWHVWNECYVQNTWLPLDATVGRGVVGPDHIRVNSGDFDAMSLAESMLPVAKLVGRVEIQIQ